MEKRLIIITKGNDVSGIASTLDSLESFNVTYIETDDENGLEKHLREGASHVVMYPGADDLDYAFLIMRICTPLPYQIQTLSYAPSREMDTEAKSIEELSEPMVLKEVLTEAFIDESLFVPPVYEKTS